MVGTKSYTDDQIDFIFDQKARGKTVPETIKLAKDIWPKRPWRDTGVRYVLTNYKNRYLGSASSTNNRPRKPTGNNLMTTVRKRKKKLSTSLMRTTIPKMRSSSSPNSPIFPRQQNELAAEMREVAGGPMLASFASPQPLQLLNSGISSDMEMVDHAVAANELGIEAIRYGTEVLTPPVLEEHPRSQVSQTLRSDGPYRMQIPASQRPSSPPGQRVPARISSANQYPPSQRYSFGFTPVRNMQQGFEANAQPIFPQRTNMFLPTLPQIQVTQTTSELPQPVRYYPNAQENVYPLNHQSTEVPLLRGSHIPSPYLEGSALTAQMQNIIPMIDPRLLSGNPYQNIGRASHPSLANTTATSQIRKNTAAPISERPPSRSQPLNISSRPTMTSLDNPRFQRPFSFPNTQDEWRLSKRQVETGRGHDSEVAQFRWVTSNPNGFLGDLMLMQEFRGGNDCPPDIVNPGLTLRGVVLSPSRTGTSASKIHTAISAPLQRDEIDDPKIQNSALNTCYSGLPPSTLTSSGNQIDPASQATLNPMETPACPTLPAQVERRDASNIPSANLAQSFQTRIQTETPLNRQNNCSGLHPEDSVAEPTPIDKDFTTDTNIPPASIIKPVSTIGRAVPTNSLTFPQVSPAAGTRPRPSPPPSTPSWAKSQASAVAPPTPRSVGQIAFSAVKRPSQAPASLGRSTTPYLISPKDLATRAQPIYSHEQNNLNRLTMQRSAPSESRETSPSKWRKALHPFDPRKVPEAPHGGRSQSVSYQAPLIHPQCKHRYQTNSSSRCPSSEPKVSAQPLYNYPASKRANLSSVQKYTAALYRHHAAQFHQTNGHHPFVATFEQLTNNPGGVPYYMLPGLNREPQTSPDTNENQNPDNLDLDRILGLDVDDDVIMTENGDSSKVSPSDHAEPTATYLPLPPVRPQSKFSGTAMWESIAQGGAQGENNRVGALGNGLAEFVGFELDIFGDPVDHALFTEGVGEGWGFDFVPPANVDRVDGEDVASSRAEVEAKVDVKPDVNETEMAD